MMNIHTLKDISGGSSLGEPLLNRYLLSQVELIEQLSRAKKDRKTAIDWGNQVADKYEELDEENKCIQDDLNQFQKENDTLNDEIKHIQYSLDQTITERDDLKHLESLKDQVAERCEVLNEENKCIHASLDQLKKDNNALIEENKCIQASLDQSKKDNDALIEENRRMQNSQKQNYTRIKELYNDNDELYSQISSKHKFHAELTANYLKKLKSHKFTINALENKLKDQQECAGLLIFPLRARVNEQRNELERLQNELERLKLEHSSQGPNRTESSDKVQNDHDASPLKNPAKHDSTIDETTCSKISAEASSQKSAEQNITSAVPSIAILGAGKALPLAPTAASEEYITPSMFHVMYFILAILVIWCVFKLIEKFQSSSDLKDDYVHLPEKMVYISDLTPARGTQSQRLLHN
jgi:myosin heavy subunit